MLTRRAAQCAVDIRDRLNGMPELEKGVKLNVKLGLGVGAVSILHVGGVFGRMEYVAIGEPLVQAFNAEHHADIKEGRDVLVWCGR